MNAPEQPLEVTPEDSSEGEERSPDGLPEPTDSMQEYYQLQLLLFRVTLILTALIFPSVWIFYSFNTALNYLIGACTGVVYLKLLARDVERLGRQKKQVGKGQLAVFIGLIIIASQIDELNILPIFLGFLTYKVAILVYMFRTLAAPNS